MIAVAWQLKRPLSVPNILFNGHFEKNSSAFKWTQSKEKTDMKIWKCILDYVQIIMTEVKNLNRNWLSISETIEDMEKVHD